MILSLPVQDFLRGQPLLCACQKPLYLLVTPAKNEFQT